MFGARLWNSNEAVRIGAPNSDSARCNFGERQRAESEVGAPPFTASCEKR